MSRKFEGLKLIPFELLKISRFSFAPTIHFYNTRGPSVQEPLVSVRELNYTNFLTKLFKIKLTKLKWHSVERVYFVFFTGNDISS